MGKFMPGPEQGGGQGENSYDLLWGVAFLIAIILVLWFFARGPIIQGLFLLKLGQIKFLSLFTNNLEITRQQILAVYGSPTSLPYEAIRSLLASVGNYMRYPYAAICALFSIWIFAKHPSLKFKNVFDMARLRVLEQENWPQISPIIKLDLVTEDINKGPWAMSESPMEFAKRLKLLEELPTPIDPFYRQRGLTEVKVIEDKAIAVFKKQLGPAFDDLNKLPIHVKALFAIFAARASNDGKGAAELTQAIARSSLHGKLDFSKVMPLLRKHYNTKAIARIIGSHAYVYTVMAAMLELARTTGVLPPADFLWLKPLDRQLWYVLNCTGRRTAFCEVAGPFSHYKAELALKRKLIQPMVNAAVNALKEAVKLTIYTRDE